MDFIDGTLPEKEKQLFATHLDDCPECVKFFETYKQTPAVSRECFIGKMPQAVKDAVTSFLRGRCKD